MNRVRMRPTAILTALALTAALAIGAGCGGDDGGGKGAGAAKGTFVGKVDGTDAYIAVTSNGDQVGGYLCDSKQVSAWFGASDLSSDRGDLVSRAGKVLGEASFDGESTSGEVEIDGQRHPFSAKLASGDSGLYRGAEGGDYGVVGNLEAAWVVLPDDSQRGATTHWTDPNPDPVVQVNAAPRLPAGATNVAVSGAKLRVQPWTDPNPTP